MFKSQFDYVWVLNICNINVDLLLLISTLALVPFGILCAMTCLTCFIDYVKVKTRIFSKSKDIWFFSTLIFLLVWICLFFVLKSPFESNIDSHSIIEDASTCVSSNHFPAYYTLLLQLFIRVFSVFSNLNFGISAFCIFQIIVTAFVCGFSVLTLCQIKTDKRLVFAVFFVFLLMPLNILYACTIGKDGLFGIFVLLALVLLLRLTKHVGNMRINYVLFAVSLILVCLFRPNGLIAVVIFSAIVTFILWKLNKRIIWTCLLALGIALIFKYPVLSMMNIQPEYIAESMSVPLQQINKVARYKNDISEEDAELLDIVLPYDIACDYYCGGNADSIKASLLHKNPQYFQDHIFEYADLYFKYLIKHPITYLTAFVEQTVGFWNAGYAYDTYLNNLKNAVDNDKTDIDVIDMTLYVFSATPILQLFISCGFLFWVLLLVLYLAIKKSDKSLLVCCILLLSIFLTFVLSTPLWSEYRYEYFMFLCVPFLFCTIFSTYDILNANKQIPYTMQANFRVGTQK